MQPKFRKDETVVPSGWNRCSVRLKLLYGMVVWSNTNACAGPHMHPLRLIAQTVSVKGEKVLANILLQSYRKPFAGGGFGGQWLQLLQKTKSKTRVKTWRETSCNYDYPHLNEWKEESANTKRAYPDSSRCLQWMSRKRTGNLGKLFILLQDFILFLLIINFILIFAATPL